jgi:predicted Rdx family selenoprotein
MNGVKIVSWALYVFAMINVVLAGIWLVNGFYDTFALALGTVAFSVLMGWAFRMFANMDSPRDKK